MPHPLLGDRPMTPTERSARRRQMEAEREARLREALRRVIAARTIREAREVAEAALR